MRAFRDAEIDGLHLLELSPTEMTGGDVYLLFSSVD